jgi:hypothetical protein
MSIDETPPRGMLLGGTAHGDQHDGSDPLHVREVRARVVPEGPARGDIGDPEGLPEVQEPVLEHAAAGTGDGHGQEEGQREASQEDLTVRRGPKRVRCSHCGARVLTRLSGSMWRHNASGQECRGSLTWDYFA